MNAHTFMASWPIEDQDMTLAQAQAEAERVLPDLLVEQTAVLVGEPSWRLADAREVGRPESDGIVLVMTAPAAPWTSLAAPTKGRHARTA